MLKRNTKLLLPSHTTTTTAGHHTASRRACQYAHVASKDSSERRHDEITFARAHTVREQCDDTSDVASDTQTHTDLCHWMHE